MKLLNVAKYSLLALCVSGILSSPALAKKGHYNSWNNHLDNHWYGNDRHGYQINNSNYVRGRVINVQPIYKKRGNKRKQQNCWLEPDPRYHRQHYNMQYRDNTLETIAGAVVGGAIGNQFGSGSGNKVATVAGAMIGGAIANEHSSGHHHHYHYHYRNGKGKGKRINNHRNHGFVEVCDGNYRHGKHHNRKIKGYHVTYKYKGDIYQSFTRRHPGKFIDLVVSVIPRN